MSSGAAVVAAYRTLFGQLGGDWRAACDQAWRWLDDDVLVRWPHLRAEHEAAARAAGSTAGEAAFVWCRSELLGAAGMYGAECTSAASTRPGAGPLVGQTWDWHPSFAGLLEARHLTAPDGTPAVVVAEAGQPTKLGLNGHGVWVGLTWMLGSRPVETGDVPLHVALRLAIEQASTAAAAVALLSRMPLAQACSFPVAGPDGVVTVERHPGADAAVLVDGGGWSVHTNHPVDPRIVAAQGEDPWRPESSSRASAAAIELAGAAVTVGGLAHALSDRSVAYDGDPSEADEDRIATLAAVIADPGSGRILLCPTKPFVGAPATEHLLDGAVHTTTWGEAPS